MLDESSLRRFYLEELRSIRDIAAIEHVSIRTIYEMLIRFRIPRRTAGFRGKRVAPENTLFAETNLRHLYLEEARSIRDIAALYQVSTRRIYDALRHYRIPRRIGARRHPAPSVIVLGNRLLDKMTLQHLYQDEGQSIAAVAAAVTCSPARVRNALVRWGIARRRRGRHYDPTRVD